LMPAAECPFEGVLYEVVGGLTVSAQQSVSIAPQSWDMRFEKFGRVSGCTLCTRWDGRHWTTSDTEAASGIAKCFRATINQRPEK
jgi:hypothetical protein